MRERGSCTLADLLGESDLGLRLVTPDVDLTRPVRWVQTTELVDPTAYLRPDELVCTVGTSLTSEPAIRSFVEALTGAATGLCFGVGDVHEQIPRSLAEACRRAGLPLLSLPFGVPFLAVADVVDKLRGQASEAEALGRLVAFVQSGLARPESLHDVLVTRGLDPSRLIVATWPPGSAALLSDSLREGAVADTGDRTVTLCASLESVRQAAVSTRLRCGYSDPTALADLRSALSSAELAFAAAPTGGDPCGPDQLASLPLLLASVPQERLRPFIVRIIEPLVAAGQHASPTYVETLRAYLEHDLSVSRTAKAQFLHPNTVRHRLALISDLTGKDPFVTEDLLALAVAVFAHDNERRP